MRDSPITTYNINFSCVGVHPSEQPLYERVYLSPGGLAPCQGDYFEIIKTQSPFAWRENLDCNLFVISGLCAQ